MQLGTFADGRGFGYDKETYRFDVGGTPVSAADVAAWDEAGQITWSSEAQREWFVSTGATAFAEAVRQSESRDLPVPARPAYRRMGAATPAAPSSPQPMPSRPVSPASRPRRISSIVLIVVLIALLAFGTIAGGILTGRYVARVISDDSSSYRTLDGYDTVYEVTSFQG